ncbi:MAG: helix-turn-helix domain-containing protein [Pseudomonadota bacterium]
MKRSTFSEEPCSIARSLDILGDWWNPLILRECLYGIHRFQDIQQWLNIGRNILTTRLKQLVEEGLLEKRQYQSGPPRFEYHLTEKGYDATLVLMAVMSFGEKWYFKDNAAPILLHHRETGHQVKPVLVDEFTGERIDPRQLVPAPGPSFPPGEVRKSRFAEFYADENRVFTRSQAD